MAAESLLNEVEEKRKKTIDMLEAEYSAKKAEVTNRASEQKAYISDSSKKEAAALAQRERIRITGAAKLQSKKMIFDATERMLENNVTALRQSLSDVTGSKEYPALLSKMLGIRLQEAGSRCHHQG